MITLDVDFVARKTASLTGQIQIMGMGKYPFTLALTKNPNLDPEVKQSIIANLIKFDDNSHLEEITTAATRNIIYMIDNYDFAKVLAAAISELPKEAALHIYASPFFNDTYRGLVLATGNLDSNLVPDFWNKLTQRLGERNRDEYYFAEDVITAIYTKYPALTDEFIVQVIQASGEIRWTESEGDLFCTAKAIDVRPSLLPILLANTEPGHVYESISASRHLFEPDATEFLARMIAQGSAKKYNTSMDILAKNPNLSYTSKLMAHQLLLAQGLATGYYTDLYLGPEEWERCIEEDKRNIKAGATHITTSWESACACRLDVINDFVRHMGAFPSLSGVPGIISKPAEDKAFTDTREKPQSEYIKKALTPYLDQAGPTAWKLFLHLLPDWKSEISELLTVVSSTAK